MSKSTSTRRENERKYFRVRCRIAIRWKRVAPNEIEQLEHEILERKENNDVSQLDPDIAAWMDRIELKLDRVLAKLGAEIEELRPSTLETVVLSGGGIQLTSPERFASSETLLLELELPGPPAHPVRCLASVVAVSDEPDGGCRVALTYTAIQASDREAIIRYTLAVERGERRSRADERVAS